MLLKYEKYEPVFLIMYQSEYTLSVPLFSYKSKTPLTYTMVCQKQMCIVDPASKISLIPSK
jgi:hypothetical protein